MKRLSKILSALVLTLLLSVICFYPGEPAMDSEPAWPGYSGPKGEYTYYYSERRDLAWEEDLIFFANSHLSDNQLLQKGLFLVNLPGSKNTSATFYNEKLLQSVLTAVNELVPQITDLSDDEILWRIQKIAAMFSDAHTTVYLNYDTVFPIFFMPINENGEWIFYTVILPQENEDLLYSKLIAINNHPIDTVVDSMRSFVSFENDYGLIHSLANGGCGSEYLSLTNALEATGNCPINSSQAKYTLMDQDGNVRDLDITATEDTGNLDLCGISLVDALTVPFQYEDSENYWYSTDLASSTLYVRISSFAYEEGENYLNFSGALTVESNTIGHFNKVILDLRDNGGGHQGEGWRAIINALGRMDYDALYILVDGGTYSCSMLFAAEMKYQIPEAVIVGSPTGEAPGFFAGLYQDDYFLPNCGIEFTVPTQYYQAFDDNKEHTLIPDVVVWLTAEDYFACYDSALEYVLAQ